MKSSKEKKKYSNNDYSVFTAEIFINFLGAGSSPKSEFL